MSLQTYLLPINFALGTGKKIINLPVGQKSLHMINIVADFVGGTVDPTLAQWATYISQFRLIVDDVQLPWQDCQTYIDLVITRNGQTAENGLLPVFFARPWEDDLMQREMFKIGTNNIKKLQIEIDFLIAPSAFVSYAELGANDNIGKVYYIRNRNIDAVAGAAEVRVDDVPSGDGRFYESLGFHYKSTVISDIVPWFGDNKVTESTAILRAQQDRQTGKTAVAGYTHFDIAKRGTIYESMTMLSPDFVLETTFTGAQAAYVLAQECVQDFNVTRSKRGGVPMVVA